MGHDQDQAERQSPSAELCDWCGTVLYGSERYGIVPDSSALHSVDARLDGGRLVVACSREHLRCLFAQYRQRPFVREELWFGQYFRAMQQLEAEVQQTGVRVDVEDLPARIKMTAEQIARGLDWFMGQARRLGLPTPPDWPELPPELR